MEQRSDYINRRLDELDAPEREHIKQAVRDIALTRIRHSIDRTEELLASLTR